jgi:hypothetical protein
MMYSMRDGIVRHSRSSSSIFSIASNEAAPQLCAWQVPCSIRTPVLLARSPIVARRHIDSQYPVRNRRKEMMVTCWAAPKVITAACAPPA